MRPDHERNRVYGLPGLEPDRVKAAGQIVCGGKRERRLPTRVLEIVVVKVGGRVLVRRRLVVEGAPTPAVTRA